MSSHIGNDHAGSLSRRSLLGGFAAVTAGAVARGQSGAEPAATTPALPRPMNPNILIIMVDQFRSPIWLSPAQQTLLNNQVLPNIYGRIRNQSVVFANHYVAATACMPARSTFMTGLYTPQTSMFLTRLTGYPSLNPAFPTWGHALAALNPAYQGNVWWFGKWHLSNWNIPSPLAPHGFRTRTYPSIGAPSPDGCPNEGTSGGLFPPMGANQLHWARDSEIAADFVSWLQTQRNAPWCATVSLINPHDIAHYPAWFPPNPYPPSAPLLSPAYFPPPAGPPANYLYSNYPSPWNGSRRSSCRPNRLRCSPHSCKVRTR